MTQTVTYQQMGPAARNQAHTLFAQTMAYVAVTAALFALGAWLGRNLTGGWASSRSSPRSPPCSACGSRPGGPCR